MEGEGAKSYCKGDQAGLCHVEKALFTFGGLSFCVSLTMIALINKEFSTVWNSHTFVPSKHINHLKLFNMKTKVLFVSAILAALSLTASSQDDGKRFGIEISAGPSIATRNFVDGLKPGYGYDGAIHFRVLPNAGIYAGWGYNWFSNSTGSPLTDRDYEETGYVLGLQYKRQLDGYATKWFVRGGAIYNHIEVENDLGDILADSGHGFGFQVAGGIDIDLGRSWSLTPVVKYNNLSRYLDEAGEGMDVQYNYLTVRVGILKRF